MDNDNKGTAKIITIISEEGGSYCGNCNGDLRDYLTWFHKENSAHLQELHKYTAGEREEKPSELELKCPNCSIGLEFGQDFVPFKYSKIEN